LIIAIWVQIKCGSQEKKAKKKDAKACADKKDSKSCGTSEKKSCCSHGSSKAEATKEEK
jgi:hypothetical protein